MTSEHQSGPADLIKGDTNSAPILEIELYRLFRRFTDDSDKDLLTVKVFMDSDLRLLAEKAFEIAYAFQRPLEAGRRHFEVIGMIDHILDIKELSDLTTDIGTMIDGDAFFPVYKETQDPAMSFPAELDIDQFQSHRRQKDLSECSNLVRNVITHIFIALSQPTGTFRKNNLIL